MRIRTLLRKESLGLTGVTKTMSFEILDIRILNLFSASDLGFRIYPLLGAIIFCDLYNLSFTRKDCA